MMRVKNKKNLQAKYYIILFQPKLINIFKTNYKQFVEFSSRLSIYEKLSVWLNIETQMRPLFDSSVHSFLQSVIHDVGLLNGHKVLNK